jgi:hypothetical protein
MPPEHARSFGGGPTETSLNPYVLIVTIVGIILMLVVRRKYVTLPFLLLTFLVPLGQQVVLGGVHLSVSRGIILAGIVRLLGARSSVPDGILAGGSNSVDRAFIWCTICQTLGIIILFQDAPAVINQFGSLLDTLGPYVLLRFLIRDEDDIYINIKCFAVIAMSVGICMIIEQVSHLNIFYFIGGARIAPEIRDGAIRSQGVFLHPLLAGTFGATLLPLFLLLWKNGKAKAMSLIGIVGACIMTITANSSTPLTTFAAGLVAVVLWPLRRKMRAVRWAIVGVLLGFSVVMKAPVWFIIAHVDLTGSSSAYHRAVLIDQFIRHFSDWWLVGVKDTGTWGWDLWDTQNQYVNVGEAGGLGAFILFIAMICCCFRRLGNTRRSVVGGSESEWRVWFLGAALFAHVVGFFGVNYFDQSRVGWFALLAMICAATTRQLPSPATRECEEDSAASDPGLVLA